jgi:dipeptidyl-peptidase-4
MQLRLLLGLILLFVKVPLVAQDKLLTIDDLYDPQKKINFNGKSLHGLSWLKDGEHYLRPAKNGPPSIVEARSGQSTPLVEADLLSDKFAALPGFSQKDAGKVPGKARYRLDPNEVGILITYDKDLYYYHKNNEELRRLTRNSEEEKVAGFSPSGEWISFVRGFDLHVIEVETGEETRLTAGDSSTLRNGLLDWVYQEEIYGRYNYKGYWWSPDSRYIAFLQLDNAKVPEFTVINHLPLHLDRETYHYPKAGDPNPVVQLGVLSIRNGTTKWVDLNEYDPVKILIVRVGWHPENEYVIFQVQDREQRWLDLNKADVSDGSVERLLRERSEAWVNVLGEPHFLEDGSFLWQSERTGYRHLYHCLPDGKVKRPLTSGEWEVRDLEGINEDTADVFFSGTKDSPIGQQVYRVRLDGTGLKRITEEEGSHTADFNSKNTLFIDSWSRVDVPTKVFLSDAEGHRVRGIEENKVEELDEYTLGPVEFLQVKTRDGFTMEAMMIKPPDFDPSEKYPVMSYTYSGPHSQSVTNRWRGTTGMWHQMLAQKGYIIWACDNRTASGKGVKSTWPGYRNLGELELRDLEDGLDWLKSQPYVDGSRIGLWGWSYGGYMTAYAMTHSKSFKVGISGAPVTDWSLYDSVYTERYMAMPQNNREGYDASSVLKAAGDLHGKLLLIHGSIDDNVHIQNTLKFAYELQKAGKQFDLMVYPKSRHGVSDAKQVKHLRQMMTQFILDNL